MTRSIAAALVALLATACAHVPSQEEIDVLMKAAVGAAEARADEGDLAEAAVLLRSVRNVDPEYPGVKALSERLGPEIANIENRSWLGINRRLRVYEGGNFLWRLLMYVPDRAFDLLDLVSAEVHFGFGLFANAHVTRAVQLGAGLRSKVGIGLYDQRIIGLATETEVGVAALSLGTQSFSGSSFGIPGGVAVGGGAMAGMHWPSDELYQTYRDYWAVGASATAGIIGLEADIHPMQLVDFIGGIFFMDPAHDDLATTRRLRFGPLAYEAIRALNQVQQDRLWKGEPAGEPAPAD